MAPLNSLLVRAAALISCDADLPQGGVTFEALHFIEDAAILTEHGRIRALGPRAEVELQARSMEVEEIDVGSSILTPGFVDAHTHPLFAGNRELDFQARQRGEAAPLGMLYTVSQTRDALLRPEHFWSTIVEPRLHAMLAHGTTSSEVKTGYALHRPGELALLDLLAAHADCAAIPRIVPTFLGAHALPPEFTDEGAFIDYLIDQCLPYAKAHGAIYADAFCELGFFSPKQTRRYLLAARSHGLRLRVHCDEMQLSEAAEMALDIGVDAIDHANYMTEADMMRLASAECTLVACPATSEYLSLKRRPDVRSMLDRGGSVALASDFNPGTSPCFNLAHVAYLGRRFFSMSAAEALDAVTRQAARSLRTDAGSLYVGGRADFIALDLDSPEEFGWMHGGNLASLVVRAGRVVS